MIARVEKISDKEFAVLVGEKIIGSAKNQFDADFHKNTINDAVAKLLEAK